MRSSVYARPDHDLGGGRRSASGCAHLLAGHDDRIGRPARGARLGGGDRRDAVAWLREQRTAGTWIVGVELAEEAIRLGDLPAARQRTIAVLGHEQTGIPPEALDLLDAAVEIPMIGSGASLNVAVAGSLVLYRLAGFL